MGPPMFSPALPIAESSIRAGGFALISLSASNAYLCPRVTSQGPPWIPMGIPGRSLQIPEPSLGGSWQSFAVYGAPWGVLGAVFWAPLGVLGAPWGLFGRVVPNFGPTPRKYRACRVKQASVQTCEYMEREARFCKGYCMREDVLGLYLDLSQRMYS